MNNFDYNETYCYKSERMPTWECLQKDPSRSRAAVGQDPRGVRLLTPRGGHALVAERKRTCFGN